MQTENTVVTETTETTPINTTPVTTSNATTPETTSKPVATKQSKAERKAARKAVKLAASKAVKPATKPDAETDTANIAIRRTERAIARDYVADFYAGASCPFKSAHDTFKPLNFGMQKQSTTRQAALIAAMLLADTSGNIKPDGTFTRGGFVVHVKPDANGKLKLSKAADAKPVTMQPESGCTGDMLGRVITYVSGPKSGAAQREQILKLNFAVAERELSEKLGGKLSHAARARIAELRGDKPSKPSKLAKPTSPAAA